MKIKYIPLLLYSLSLLALFSCRQDEGTNIRNVRFDPSLLNQARNGSCETYSYTYQDEKASLGNVYTKQVIVTFADGSTHAQQQELTQKYGFVSGIKSQTPSNSAMLYTLELTDGLNCKQTEQALKVLANDPLVTYAAPYFVKSDNLLGISNEAIVTVAADGKADLDALLSSYNATIVSPLGDAVYVVKVDKSANGNALDLANYLSGQDGIAHAEPDFIVSLAPEEPLSNRRLKRNGVTR